MAQRVVVMYAGRKVEEAPVGDLFRRPQHPRVLEVKKNNYGPLTASVPIRWQDGVFVLAAKDAFDQVVAEALAEEIFMTPLSSFTAQGRNVTDKHSPSYAPTQFAAHPDAKQKRVGTADFAGAMERLFAAGRIAPPDANH
jgi:hypothetical protein